MGQRAVVPSSAIMATVTPANTQSMRTDMPVYAAYQVHGQGLFAYFSFDPSLPHSNITTENARRLLKYAYLNFEVKQPADVGGSLTVLSSSDTLKLGDFERFEVEGDVRVTFWACAPATSPARR
jgi:hypothetical protein